MRVEEVMSRDPIVLAPDETLDVAEMLMNFAHIRHLPVTENGIVVGLVTHRDLLRACVQRMGANCEPSARTAAESKELVQVAEIMRVDVRTIDAKSDVREAIDIMIDHKYGCLPVTEKRHLVGIITEADFLKLARRHLSERRDR
ncbi:MAG: CBS domain-containing protein [Planctomycetota bacterium]